MVERLNLNTDTTRYDEIVKVPKVFGSIGVDKLDDVVLDYFLEIANAQYKAIFGVDSLVEKSSLTADRIREIANIANASYRTVFGIKPITEEIHDNMLVEGT